MPSQPVPPEFTGFKRLGSSTYIYEPSTSPTSLGARTAASQSPDLILLASWLDAAPKHIAKYTTGYRALYAHARILLITTSLHQMATHAVRPRTEASRLEPVLQVLAALPQGHKVLLHSFSNAGAYTSCAIATAWRARTGTFLPLGAQVLDSSPGRYGYAIGIAALKMSLPQKPALLYYLCLALLHALFSISVVVAAITRVRPLNDVVSEKVNDPRLWDVDVPRVYLYSKSDSMVDWRHVEDHAKVGEGKGWRVRKEVWDGTPHCGHLKGDEGRYWGVVSGTWESQ